MFLASHDQSDNTHKSKMKKFRLHHESDAQANAAALELKALGLSAVRLLAECVEHQGIKRKTISKSAEALYSAGFIFIRGTVFYSDDAYDLSPSLAGEEALESLEEQLDATKAKEVQ
jgi:pyruvate/2-oxoacid:ferredoxin oxidoreductase beta subunit